MKKARWVSAAAGTVVLVAGFAAPASAALADGGGNGNGGVLSVLSGNNVNAPVSLPVDVCGVAVGLLGGADAGCAGGAASNTDISNGGGGGNGNGNAGVASVGSGNTVNLPVSVPANVCGVAGSVAGFSNAHCQGGAASNTVIDNGSGGNGNGNAGDISALSGNTVNAPISAPADVCGIAVALLGFSNASCLGGAASNTVIGGGSGGGAGGNGNGNAGQISALSGNTLNAPVSIPVNVCGVSAAVAGFANSDCQGGAASNTVIGGTGGSGNGNAGGLSLLSGNNVNLPISAPLNACGIAVGLLGFSNASCQGGSFSNTTIGGGPTQTPCPTPPPSCGCTPPKHHHKMPPPKHHHHKTPPGGGGGGGMPPGNQGTGSQGTPPNHGNGSATTSVPGSLPITGANILGMLVAAAGLVGIGGTSLVIARRRRNGEA
jgi:ChpA-C